jgi:predicted XRE-type DNA-binding protein
MTMATKSTIGSRSAERGEPVTRGSRNVFADLGFVDATVRQAKLRLAYELNQLIERRGFNQTAGGRLLGLSQASVSAIKSCKLAGFTIDRLINLLIALDQGIEIVIHRSRSRKGERIAVH